MMGRFRSRLGPGGPGRRRFHHYYLGPSPRSHRSTQLTIMDDTPDRHSSSATDGLDGASAGPLEAVQLAGPVADRDAHAELDPEEILADVTVVIPTARESTHTLDSVPEYMAVEIRRDDGLNVARNRGVEAAETEWIALVDDDITFPTRLTAMLVDGMHEWQLVGAEDFWPLRYVIGRYMLFHRTLFDAVGGFDESRPHGGDSDFAIRCAKAGASVCRIPRRLIPHHDERSSFTTAQHLEWLWYLSRRHPRVGLPATLRLALKRLGILRPRPEYPDGWASNTFRPPDREGES